MTDYQVMERYTISTTERIHLTETPGVLSDFIVRCGVIAISLGALPKWRLVLLRLSASLALVVFVFKLFIHSNLDYVKCGVQGIMNFGFLVFYLIALCLRTSKPLSVGKLIIVKFS